MKKNYMTYSWMVRRIGMRRRLNKVRRRNLHRQELKIRENFLEYENSCLVHRRSEIPIFRTLAIWGCHSASALQMNGFIESKTWFACLLWTAVSNYRDEFSLMDYLHNSYPKVVLYLQDSIKDTYKLHNLMFYYCLFSKCLISFIHYNIIVKLHYFLCHYFDCI